MSHIPRGLLGLGVCSKNKCLYSWDKILLLRLVSKIGGPFAITYTQNKAPNLGLLASICTYSFNWLEASPNINTGKTIHYNYFQPILINDPCA